MSQDLVRNLDSVRRRIADAARAADREPDDVTLIAVSKTHAAAVVDEAVAAGAVDLGENRVQEAVAKKPEVRPARWHLIGPLQRNKAKAALDTFDVIHTVDRPEIVDRLHFLLEQHWPERVVDVLLEINVGDEPQKAGVAPDDAPALLGSALDSDRLQVRGVMAIPPYTADAESSRRFFRKLREVRDRLQDSSGRPLPELSMGMSHDFEVAVAEGATMVRVGTAIFGPRGS
ncbi:MAG: YggS family pyridoxal phosphate-dependent enzyme [Holophagae bacterium]|jgi:pyridoxal phosphate enzyme (YggS family)